MGLQDEAEVRARTAALQKTVMAALSQRQRQTAHPADLRQLSAEARRVALAIQAEFAVFAREEPAASARLMSSTVVTAYE